MHQESHRLRLVLDRGTIVPGRAISRASVCGTVRACVYACMRVNLNKSHMSFPYARVTQPVVCVYMPRADMNKA